MTTEEITTTETTTETPVCYRHPKTETGLRCNKCNRYICAKCAKRTPVGYTCPECIRQQENKYFTGNFADYIIATVIALPLSFITALIFIYLIGGIGFFSWIIAFIAAPFASGIIAEAVRRGVSKRRSRYLAHVVSGCLIGATLVIILPTFWDAIAFGQGINPFGLIVPAILLFLGTGTIMTRLR